MVFRYWASKLIKTLRIECLIFSLKYCSHLISQSNQLNFCLVKRTNLKKLDTTKAQQPPKPFSDVEIVIIYEWNIQRMLEIFATFMHCPLLGLIILSQTSESITFLNHLKAFDSSDIHYIRKCSTPLPFFILKNQATIKVICFMPVICNLLTSYIYNV